MNHNDGYHQLIFAIWRVRTTSCSCRCLFWQFSEALPGVERGGVERVKLEEELQWMSQVAQLKALRWTVVPMAEPKKSLSVIWKNRLVTSGYCGLILSWCPWPFWPDFWGTWSVCCGNVTRNGSQAISRHGVDTINMLTSGSQTWQSQPSIDRWFSHFNTHYCKFIGDFPLPCLITRG